MEKIIIVGGVAGGMSAATRLRRLKEEAEIIIFEKGPYVSFANCGLPYYVSGEISERDKLLVQTPEALYDRFRLDVRPEHEVLSINPEEKTVTAAHHGKQITESYDKLILSPGAKAFIPPVEGLDEAENVYTLRNVPDLDKIMNRIDQVDPKEAVVVGAGFIGIEMAENLKHRGIDVTIIEKAPHVLPPLDEEMAVFVQNELKEKGVKVITSQSAVAFKEKGRIIVLEDGKEFKTDLTIMSVGVKPESSLAEHAGIELGLRGGILVDDTYQTSVKDIYAVGDAIVVKNQISQEDALISLASPANRQGRQVADNIAGISRANKGSIGTAIVRAFDMTAASTGLNERQLRQAGKDVASVHTLSKDHAGYYPGATDITLKVIFDPVSGTLYGAQGVGVKGVDKRIDVIATAIKGGLTVFDLPELEFTYAPPFGSAKDPVNMAGYAALNIIEGLSDSIQWHELNRELKKGAVLLDVRTESELESGRFPNALNIPLNDLRDRMDELDKEQEYIISCRSGQRSYIGERLLKQSGFKVKNLDGAYALYQAVRPEELEYV
ncbi:FAD-dependent oxidoreductase [Alkalibacterium pelagium]|uniref:NADPH-dependent 2,4-dienoyl-CoA reductase, sulfur reductase n=1 Tax=Alkalibacterium pelagium TaxID=426702 RepID=A0A1H7KEL8_9LACT|nr:FAD-dependent oxidoreductase [Alkalibacterium pelagium]GEN50772.1 CoA-disulfide reductase [Alkalibacterium pelagium]SEK85268.1 NADPH-dependent 2,4-dienoyl-CoA reductase, sulfur reductase [Alkalibacterium pelagium]